MSTIENILNVDRIWTRGHSISQSILATTMCIIATELVVDLTIPRAKLVDAFKKTLTRTVFDVQSQFDEDARDSEFGREDVFSYWFSHCFYPCEQDMTPWLITHSEPDYDYFKKAQVALFVGKLHSLEMVVESIEFDTHYKCSITLKVCNTGDFRTGDKWAFKDLSTVNFVVEKFAKQQSSVLR